MFQQTQKARWGVRTNLNGNATVVDTWLGFGQHHLFLLCTVCFSRGRIKIKKRKENHQCSFCYNIYDLVKKIKVILFTEDKNKAEKSQPAGERSMSAVRTKIFKAA